MARITANIESGEKRRETENKKIGKRSSETVTATGPEVTVMTDLGGIMNEGAEDNDRTLMGEI